MSYDEIRKEKSDMLRNTFSYDDDLWRKTKYSAMQMTFSMLLSSSSMMKWNVYPFYFDEKTTTTTTLKY